MKPTFAIIVAVDRNNLIGDGHSMPWSIPEDLAYFKKTTMGHPIVMGRKTYESIGKPLPGRKNIVLSSNIPQKKGFIICRAIEDLVSYVEHADLVFIIGGASVYNQFIEKADLLYITRIDAEFEGSVFFSNINYDNWMLTSKKNIISKYPLSFEIYRKRCK